MKFEEITPETYEKMNEEFEDVGLAFRIIVPSQKEIDDWRRTMIDNTCVVYTNGSQECERVCALLEHMGRFTMNTNSINTLHRERLRQSLERVLSILKLQSVQAHRQFERDLHYMDEKGMFL